MGSQEGFAHHGHRKRLRSLGSVLWDTDEELSHEDWLASRPSACCCEAKIKNLEKEIEMLRNQNSDLHIRLKVASLPVVPLPELTVKKPHMARKQQVDPWYWLSMVPDCISTLPRMAMEVVPDLERTGFAGNHVAFDVTDASIPSAILDHCELAISSLSSKYPAVFKVGITCNPVARWLKGYSQDSRQKWQQLKVLVILPDPVSVGFVEAALIRRFQSTPGNMNIQRGGEGVDLTGAGPYFVYVAYRCLIPPRKT